MMLLWLNNLNMGASPSGAPSATIVSIDPRAGTILDDDQEPAAPDPRAGTILS
jgi:hypothetical protein